MKCLHLVCLVSLIITPIFALLLYLLHIRTHLEGIFNSLNTEQPNFDEVTVALSQYQCVLVAKIPSMLQELQRLKELQDASAQSNGDNETKDNV